MLFSLLRFLHFYPDFSGYVGKRLDKEAKVNCVCLKSKTLCNCLSSSSFLHHFSGITENSHGELGVEKNFTDHWTVNTIQLFVAKKGNFFWSILFLNK